MPLYRAKRDCNPGGIYYRQGQVVEFAKAPDLELFAPAEPGAVAETVMEPANPGGTPLNEETKQLMVKAGRPRRAAGAVSAPTVARK